MSLRKIILIVIMILIFIEVLRETGVLELNYFNSRISSSTTSNWTNSTIRVKAQTKDELWATFESQLNDPCNLQYSISNTSIQISVDGDYFISGDDSCHSIIIQASVNPGSIWTPVYKTTSFSASANCFGSFNTIEINQTELSNKVLNLSGIITLSGNLTISGFCTYKEAKRILVRHIQEQLIQRTKDQLSKL